MAETIKRTVPVCAEKPSLGGGSYPDPAPPKIITASLIDLCDQAPVAPPKCGELPFAYDCCEEKLYVWSSIDNKWKCPQDTAVAEVEETLTFLFVNGNTISYTDENGDTKSYDIEHPGDVLTSLAAVGNTLVYTDEVGNATTINIPLTQVSSTDNNNGTFTLTIDGQPVVIDICGIVGRNCPNPTVTQTGINQWTWQPDKGAPITWQDTKLSDAEVCAIVQANCPPPAPTVVENIGINQWQATNSDGTIVQWGDTDGDTQLTPAAVCAIVENDCKQAELIQTGINTWQFNPVSGNSTVINFTDTNTQLTAAEVCQMVQDNCPPPLSTLTEISPNVFNWSDGDTQIASFTTHPASTNPCNWTQQLSDQSLFTPDPNHQDFNQQVAYSVPEFIDVSAYPVGVWTDLSPEEACITIPSSPCCDMLYWVMLNPGSPTYQVDDGWVIQLSGQWTQNGVSQANVGNASIINTSCETDGCIALEQVNLYQDMFPWVIPENGDPLEICMKIRVRVVEQGVGTAEISQSNFRVGAVAGRCLGI